MEKRQLRRQILQIRDGLPQKERLHLSRKVMERLWQWEPFGTADRILSYASFRSEVDTDGIHERLLAEGRALYLPKTDPVTHQMTFYPVRHMDELVCGYQGIREPKGGLPLFGDGKENLQNSVMLMPGAAFDADRNRLGYGGGYYDRYLAQYGEYITHTCMLAFEVQRVEKIEADCYDIRPDRILTERR